LIINFKVNFLKIGPNQDYGKGQSISKCPFGVIKSSKKTMELFSRISALVSKKRSNQKSSVKKVKLKSSN
jgi:hypothetical protein